MTIDEQQGVVAGGPPDPHDGHGHDGVEVQAAEVGPEPAGAAQPVGVGHIGVERRPDEVQAGAHRSRRGAAAAGPGGMAELVEACGQHGDQQDQQHQAGVGEGFMRGRGEALDHQHPPAGREERRDDNGHHQRIEEDGERRRELAGALRVGHRIAEAHPQERIGFADLGLRSVGQLQQPERQQLGVDQGPDVVGADQPAGSGARVRGDFLEPAAAVDRLEDEVEQAGELERLPVGTPDQ